MSTSAQKPQKAKNSLTLAQKINILDSLRSGMGATAVGRVYGISESSVRYIRKQEEKIRNSMAGLVAGNIEASLMPSQPPQRNSNLVQTEQELVLWMNSAAEQNIALSPGDVREKAKEIYQNIRANSSNPWQFPDFVASKTWYRRFRRDVYGDSPEVDDSKIPYDSFYPAEMSPSTSAYETMILAGTHHINTNNDDYNNNAETMVIDPEVILLDDEEFEQQAMIPAVSINAVEFKTMSESVEADEDHRQNEILQDKGAEMETCEQSTQMSENVANNTDEANAELQNRLQHEVESHEQMREECEAFTQEVERLKELNRTLSKKLEGRDDEMIKLKALLNGKDQQIKRQRTQFDETLKNLSAANKVKSTLTNRIADQDKKIARLELHSQHSVSSLTPARQQSREELKIVRDALHSLRNSFQSNNPQQHTIDTLEQSFATLMERIHSMETQLHSIQPTDSSDTNSVMPGSLLNYDSTGDPRRSPITKLQASEGSFSSEERSEGWTKVLYYTERSVTPYLFHIPKRIGEITLKDFKDSFDRPGLYRFHFKTIDPEFGMVKEEVVHDNDIIPGLEGKVIAWIEEDA